MKYFTCESMIVVPKGFNWELDVNISKLAIVGEHNSGQYQPNFSDWGLIRSSQSETSD